MSMLEYLGRDRTSLEESLRADPGSIDDPRSAPAMIMMLTLYLLRMIFSGVLAFFAPFWFVVALTGAWLLRAELCPPK